MTESRSAGAILFFGRAGCVTCHAVSGQSNEMFSDFQQHVAGIPQIMPSLDQHDVRRSGRERRLWPGAGDRKRADRYVFRTSPLRNVALQTSFMHNGAFTTLE